jgi:hypothetical protein
MQKPKRVWLAAHVIALVVGIPGLSTAADQLPPETKTLTAYKAFSPTSVCEPTADTGFGADTKCSATAPVPAGVTPPTSSVYFLNEQKIAAVMEGENAFVNQLTTLVMQRDGPFAKTQSDRGYRWENPEKVIYVIKTDDTHGRFVSATSPDAIHYYDDQYHFAHPSSLSGPVTAQVAAPASAPTPGLYAPVQKPPSGDEVTYSRVLAAVGQTYWFNPSENTGYMKKLAFFDAPLSTGDALIHRDDHSFVPTQTVSFTVVEFQTVNLTDRVFKAHYLKVQFADGKLGYLLISGLDLPFEVYKKGHYIPGPVVYTEDPTVIAAREAQEAEVAADAARKSAAKAKAAYNAKGGVHLGMTKEEVLKSNWGRPEHVNTTTAASGTREQWVYAGSQYLYFDNGILTAIQN